jgi:hypothetical protein
MLIFIAGLMVGGMIGVVMMCLLVAGRESEAHMVACDNDKDNDAAPQTTSYAGEGKSAYKTP